MNRNRLHYRLGACAILLAVVACSLPGQAARSVPPTNQEPIQTAIAGTAQAAAEQTAAAALSTATPEGMTGTTIEQMSDGTTKYTDYDAGFEITFPVGWLTVRANSEEFNALLVGEATANSMLRDQMAIHLKEYDADYDRLYSYIVRPDIKKNVILGFSKLKWDREDDTVLDNANMGKLIRDLETQTTIPGFRVDTAQILDDGSTRIVDVSGRWLLKDGTSDPVPFYSIFYFFKPTWTSTVRVSITFVQDYQDELAADVKSIKDSITLIEP